MRLLVGVVIFVLVVLVASETVSAKKSSREQSNKKRRGPALEDANNGDKVRSTKSHQPKIHDKAHDRKHRSAEKIDWERSGAEYSLGSNGRWVEDERVESSRNSRSTSEREYVMALPKKFHDEEKTSSSDTKSTRKQKKTRESESGAKNRQVSTEDSSEGSEDDVPDCGKVAEDSADLVKCIVQKKPKREHTKRQKIYKNWSRAASSESKDEDDSEVPKNERQKREVVKPKKCVYRKSEGAKRENKQKSLEDTNEADARCDKQSEKNSRSSKKRKNNSEKSSKEIICTDSESEEILAKFTSEHQIDGRNVKEPSEIGETSPKNEEEEDEDNDETR